MESHLNYNDLIFALVDQITKYLLGTIKLALPIGLENQNN